MWCDFDLLTSFLQLVESKKVNPSRIWFLTLEPCSVVIQEMLHHIRNSCRRRGILGAGAFGITRGNFGLSWQLFLEMFYCGGSNCVEGVHRVATWFRAWFRLCAGDLTVAGLVPLFLCLLSVSFHLSFSCCGYVFVLISVCLSFIFVFPALLAEKAAKRYDLPPFISLLSGPVLFFCLPNCLPWLVCCWPGWNPLFSLKMSPLDFGSWGFVSSLVALLSLAPAKWPPVCLFPVLPCWLVYLLSLLFLASSCLHCAWHE